MFIPGVQNPPAPWVWVDVSRPLFRMQNPDTGIEVLLEIRASDKRNRVTRATFTSMNESGSVTGADLRSLPIAAIEASLDESDFSIDAQWRINEDPDNWDPFKPIKQDRKKPDFLDRVVLQFLAVRDASSNPTRHIAEINDISMTTAQAWVTAARKEGKLPPGRPGRSG